MKLLFLLLSCLAFAADENLETYELSDLPCNGERASEYGYAFESIMGLPTSELEGGRRLVQFCLETDSCKLLDIALERYQVCADAPNAITRGRLLAGLPDKHNWANSETHRCAREGGYCSCTGNVVYTKRCAGTFSCNEASWNTVVRKRWNSNHKSNVVGGVWCKNSKFGGDPFPGHDKQCFCHPKQDVPDRFDYIAKWTEAACHDACGYPGAAVFTDPWFRGLFCGFRCTGGCPAQAIAFAAGRSHTWDLGSCIEACYCVAKGWTA